MSIRVRCPDCEAELNVKDELAGRKIRCKTCGTVFQAESSTEPRSDELTDVAEDSDSGRTSKGRSSKRALAWWQRILVHASRNTWSATLLLYVLIWVPLCCVFPFPTLLAEGVLGMLLFFGIVIGLILAVIGVSISNPLEMMTLATVGVVAGMFVPAEHLSMVGKAAGTSAKKAGMKSIGDIDTGLGGQIAVYCSIGLGAIIVHFGLRTLVSFIVNRLILGN